MFRSICVTVVFDCCFACVYFLLFLFEDFFGGRGVVKNVSQRGCEVFVYMFSHVRMIGGAGGFTIAFISTYRQDASRPLPDPSPRCLI